VQNTTRRGNLGPEKGSKCSERCELLTSII
jgi:hypothetical protein